MNANVFDSRKLRQLPFAAMPDDALNLVLITPHHLRAGVYANMSKCWHTGTEFTIDFAVAPTGGQIDETSNSGTIEFDLVARIKMPPEMIFDLARQIAEEVDEFERDYRELTPRPPDDPHD